MDWRLGLRAVIGFAVGLALWLLLTPLYDRVVGAGAEAVLRFFERPAVTHLQLAEDGYTTVDRSDFDPRSKRPAISIRDLTFNFVLLTALFMASKRPFSDRNIGGFLVACAILTLTHIAGAISEVMSIYTARLGPWSTANYSDFSRNFWGVANHLYRLVLMYAIAFALWLGLRDTATTAPARASSGAKKKRKR